MSIHPCLALSAEKLCLKTSYYHQNHSTWFFRHFYWLMSTMTSNLFKINLLELTHHAAGMSQAISGSPGIQLQPSSTWQLPPEHSMDTSPSRNRCYCCHLQAEKCCPWHRQFKAPQCSSEQPLLGTRGENCHKQAALHSWSNRVTKNSVAGGG